MDSESPMAGDKGRKRQSFTRFMSKVKNGLTSSKSKVKRQSMMVPGDAGAAGLVAPEPFVPADSTVVGPSAITGKDVSSPMEATKKTVVGALAAPTMPDSSVLYSNTRDQPLKSALDERELAIARTRMLFQKYNLEFDPAAYIFTAPRTTQRIHKSVRMRVHRRCHRCENIFGSELACGTCSHRRCKKCPRYPGAGSTIPNGIPKPAASAGILERRREFRTMTNEQPKRSLYDDMEYRIAMMANLFAKWDMEFRQSDYIYGTPQQGRIEKKVRVRIHRQCHRCNATFGADRQCPNCTHSRCKKCMRVRPQSAPTSSHRRAEFCGRDNGPPERSIHDDPQYRVDRTRAIFEKYNMTFEPQEYYFPDPAQLGPRVQKRPRMRIHRRCHRCMTELGGLAACETCGHHACANCPRDPPVRAAKAPGAEKGKSRTAEGLPSGMTAAAVDPAARTGVSRVKAKPKLRVKRYCHECSAAFPSKVRTCQRCQHEQCEGCKRLPATKAPKQKGTAAMEPEVQKQVQEPGYMTVLGQKIGLLSVGEEAK